MDDAEPILLHEPDFMLAVLRAAREGPARLDDAVARLRAHLAAAGEPLALAPEELTRRFEEAARLLEGACAIVPADDGRYRLTPRGVRLLAEHPDGIDQSVLRTFPEFRAFMATTSRPGPEDDPRLPAFHAGMQAFAERRALSDNPFASDTPDHLAWECGWSEARDEALRR
ncbi:hypothetical protein [Benzoatithermus flavus]|uniref:Uncharacterized protein n=1 Tax=Benzoatithermus flavus TaxID=3108223 RepID=A0ABU8XTK9_9PROT